ncbi:MAG: ABC transporter substrate-binding protein [Lachnospiraceae bacterium]
MRNNRSKLGIGFVSAACAAVICGCGMISENERNFVSKEDSGIVIRVLAGQSTTDAGVEDMINEVMAEKFPEVELEWECVDWGDAFSSQIQGKIASGDVPDLIIGKAQDVIPYAKAGAIEAIALEGIKKIDNHVLDSVTYEGEVYGIPYNASYQGVLYNKTKFEEYGLSVPVTRDELEEVTDTLERLGEIPFATHFQESWNVGNLTMQFMIGDIFQTDAQWGDKFRAGEVRFTDSALLKETFEQNRFLLEHSYVDALIIDQYESDKRFAEGEAVMYMTGTWSLQAIEQYADDSREYGIFPYPNANGDAKLIKETNMTFMMGRGSKNKEFVETILEELLSNEKLMQEILDFTQTYPVIEGVHISYESCIHEDVDRYEDAGNIIDATSGNGQLIWTYQNQLAAETISWLQGKKELSQVFSYADEHKSDS